MAFGKPTREQEEKKTQKWWMGIKSDCFSTLGNEWNKEMLVSN